MIGVLKHFIAGAKAMRFGIGLFAAALMVSVSARADHGGAKHVCKNGSAERLVTVAYEQDGKKAPCAVRYKRDVAEPEKEIFKASNEIGYCETKADEFVAKLTALGWACEAGQ